MKYVTQTGQPFEEDDEDSDLDIALEDLFLTEEHSHIDFVFEHGKAKIPTAAKNFKSTGVAAREDQ